MRLAILLAIPLAGCQTVAIDAAFPPVPRDIAICAKRTNVAIPDRDLTAAEAEHAWKSDRLVTVEVRQCLQRLVVRDNKLAKQGK